MESNASLHDTQHKGIEWEGWGVLVSQLSAPPRGGKCGEQISHIHLCSSKWNVNFNDTVMYADDAVLLTKGRKEHSCRLHRGFKQSTKPVKIKISNAQLKKHSLYDVYQKQCRLLDVQREVH